MSISGCKRVPVQLYYMGMLYLHNDIFMAALHSKCGHYISILWFLLLSFFPRLISAVADWLSTILPQLHTWCGLSANLGCRSETCCTRLSDAKKSPKIHRLRTIAQLCRALSSQLRHLSTIGKKVLNNNTSPRCPYNMVNFGPLAAEIGTLVWAPQLISTDFASWRRYCTAL